ALDLSAFGNVTRVAITNITDGGGLAFDDFTFTAGSGPPLGPLTVGVSNGAVQVGWTTSPVYTSYVITATPVGNNRVPSPAATAVSTPPPGAPGSVSSSPATLAGLIE